MDENYFELEYKETRAHFNVEDIIEFTKAHDVQVVRGGDFQYMCFVDKQVWAVSLTPLHALFVGIKKWKEYNGRKDIKVNAE